MGEISAEDICWSTEGLAPALTPPVEPVYINTTTHNHSSTTVTENLLLVRNTEQYWEHKHEYFSEDNYTHEVQVSRELKLTKTYTKIKDGRPISISLFALSLFVLSWSVYKILFLNAFIYLYCVLRGHISEVIKSILFTILFPQYSLTFPLCIDG